MQIVHEAITISELQAMAKKRFGDMVKAVVDLEKEIMAVDAILHAEEEDLLMANGSQQTNLWGINIYPYAHNNWIEFDSIINLRPDCGNKGISVNDPTIREKIIKIVNTLVKK